MKYTIGVDFGTLSARGVLADISDGRIVSSVGFEYPHGVMDASLPSGVKLKSGFALQHPQDYLDALDAILPKLSAEVSSKDIVGVGFDCTSSTLLPVDPAGVPLCFKEAFASEPLAYAQMWKHHGAQEQARRMTELAARTNQPWLWRYGGVVNAEWFFPKVLEVLEEAPEVYQSAADFVEAMDFLIRALTGEKTRSAACLSYKAFYTERFPDESFFAALNPAFGNVVKEKVSGRIIPLGARAGQVTAEAAARYGLCPGTPVAAGNIDAHVCVPAAGICDAGKLLAIIGTSACHIVLGESARAVPGMSGVVKDGVMPGFEGYESGQSCVGDHFQWLTQNLLPASYSAQADARGLSAQAYLTELAKKLRPGQSGLLALDWWNGNRSVLADADLSGLLVGMTLRTTPEELYRALIEATAYGARVIVENYRAHGVPVDEFWAAGGVSQKNPLAMQIYADVLNMPVRIVNASQGAALGSAIFAAVAAGAYASPASAAKKMGGATAAVYRPDRENALIYEKLYREYLALHDYFGRGQNDVMKRLMRIKKEASDAADGK